MAREVLVGILIKAKETAAAAFEKTNDSAKKMGKGIDDAADRAKKGLKDLSHIVTGLNQAFELGKKALFAVKQAFEATVGATLAQRSATDRGKRDWEAYAKQLEHIKGLLGDILLPIILGIADAFKPLLKAVDQWLAKNRQLVGSQLVDWLTSIARTLVSGVATGILLVSKAWTGWKELVHLTQAVFEGFYGMVLKGLAMVIDGLEYLARAAGLDALADMLKDARDGAAGLGDELVKSAEDHVEATAQDVVAQNQLELAINKAVDAANQGIGVAAVNATRRFGQEILKTKTYLGATYGDMLRLEEAVRRGFDASRIAHEAKIANERRLEEENAQAISHARIEVEEKIAKAEADAFKTRQEQIAETVNSWKNGFNTVLQLGIEAFSGIGKEIDGHTKTWSDAVKQFGKSLAAAFGKAATEYVAAKAIEIAADKAAALFAIDTAAAEGGAKAVAAHAGIPFVGLALGLTAGAAIVTAILAFAGKFHSGGQIGGGYGREQFALVEGGEVVVRKELASAAISSGLASGSSGGAPISNAGPTRVLVETILPSRVTTDRAQTHYLTPAIQRARHRGEEV